MADEQRRNEISEGAMPCGCESFSQGVLGDSRVEFCPLHAAAPAMYAMLTMLSNPDYLPLNSITEVQWSAVALRAQALIAKIDGKEQTPAKGNEKP